MVYNLEQEWKNPGKRNRNIVIAIIALFLIWWFCGFGGSMPWALDLNAQLGAYACPDKCWVNGSSNGDSANGEDEANPDGTTRCPPITSKIRDLDLDAYNYETSACIAGGGILTRTDYEFSCGTRAGGIDCQTLATNPYNVAFMTACRAYGGVYHCQDNWVGCYCPGSGPTPYGDPSECTRIIDMGETGQIQTSCKGPCDRGSCVDDSGYCMCEGGTACNFQEGGACGGYCPSGLTCQFTQGILREDYGCQCLSHPL